MPTIHHGDCIQVMNTMPANSIDAIVTDPPYGLGFMGRKWDDLPPSLEWAEACYRVLKPGGHIAAFGGTRTWHRLAVAIEDAGFEMRDSLAWLYGSGFPKSHDVGKAIDKRPGASQHPEFGAALRAAMTAKGYTNTFDVAEAVLGKRTGAVANWIKYQFPEARWWPALRDLLDMDEARWGPVIAEAERRVTGKHGTGSPIGTFTASIDGGPPPEAKDRRDIPATPEAAQWNGWGTALKPAFEPIVLARKPLAEKTVARNVLAYGTGAINVDGCRIATDENLNGGDGRGILLLGGCHTVDELRALAEAGEKTPTGRDARATLARAIAYRERVGEYVQPSGRWPANVLLDHHAAAWVDEQSGVSVATRTAVSDERGAGGSHIFASESLGRHDPGNSYADTGGASRFFYTAKAPKRERPNVNGVQHPTVKPLAIMQWLIRLVTPPGGAVLDPFAGSGTTIEAALIEGFDPVGIEMETDYLPLIQHRIDRQSGTLTA